MAFQNNEDLENMLPTTNPNTTGIFSGNQNMNIDQSANRGTAVPPPPRATNSGRTQTYRGAPSYRKHRENQQAMQNNNQQQTSGTYGVPTEPPEEDEPPPRPAKIIKDPDLKYEGENFKDFLDRFELAAEIFGAGGFDKARQVCRFVKGEDLKKELESMEGYDTRNWKVLRESMLEIWGGADMSIRYTIKDLHNLIEFCQKKGGVREIQDYKTYQSKFLMITKYLVRNEHISNETSVSHLFFLAFPIEYQTSINRELVRADLIPTGKDGCNKPPYLEDVMSVSEDEVRARSINAFAAGSFMEANKSMQKTLDQKKGDGKKREKMIEENPPEALQKQVESLSKAIEALASKVDNQGKGEYSRGNDRPPGKLYEYKPCSYCHREGHGTGYCQEAQKDEREGLVTRDGRNFLLPNGQKIPWDPTRPIRSVVASESAKPKPQINSVYQTNHPAVFEVQKEASNNNGITSSLHRVDWEPP